MLMSKALKALSWAFSLPCPLCGGEPLDGEPNMLCGECLAKIRVAHPPLCPGCGGELSGILALCPDCLKSPKRPWSGAVAAMKMEGAAEELVYKFKYRGRPDLARPIGALLAKALEGAGLKADMIVPTPLHWTRLLTRGYNQAELLAEVVSAKTGVPMVKALRRSRRTGQQARLNRKQRFENLKGAFYVPDSTPCEKRSILLVDDVMTTGSTLSAAAEALLAAGAGNVSILIAARRQRD
jgi:competence protein ComFC